MISGNVDSVAVPSDTRPEEPALAGGTVRTCGTRVREIGRYVTVAMIQKWWGLTPSKVFMVAP